MFSKLDAYVLERLLEDPVLFNGETEVEIDEGYLVSLRKYQRGTLRKHQRSGRYGTNFMSSPHLSPRTTDANNSHQVDVRLIRAWDGPFVGDVCT